MPINIGLDKNGNPFVENTLNRRYEAVELNDDEQAAADIVFKALSNNGVPLNTVHLERRSDNYFSVVVNDVYDFCRIKMGAKSKWFSLLLLKKDRNDPRIDPNQDANKLHYKFKVSAPQDMEQYADLIFLSCQSCHE